MIGTLECFVLAVVDYLTSTTLWRSTILIKATISMLHYNLLPVYFMQIVRSFFLEMCLVWAPRWCAYAHRIAFLQIWTSATAAKALVIPLPSLFCIPHEGPSLQILLYCSWTSSSNITPMALYHIGPNCVLPMDWALSDTLVSDSAPNLCKEFFLTNCGYQTVSINDNWSRLFISNILAARRL